MGPKLPIPLLPLQKKLKKLLPKNSKEMLKTLKNLLPKELNLKPLKPLNT